MSQVVPADLAPGASARRSANSTHDSRRYSSQRPASPTSIRLQAGRIDFIPYQFRPVLKFIRADRPRILVADEVGVGKTIEAGLAAPRTPGAAAAALGPGGLLQGAGRRGKVASGNAPLRRGFRDAVRDGLALLPRPDRSRWGVAGALFAARSCRSRWSTKTCCTAIQRAAARVRRGWPRSITPPRFDLLDRR